MFPIVTERLVLRHFQPADTELVLELLNEESFLRFIGDRGVRNLEDARAYIENGPISGYARFGFGLNHVSLRDDGPAIGMCGLLKRDHLEHPDIGYAFLPRFWSQGYAVEAATAVLGAARAAGVERVLAITSLDNLGSIRVLDKLGFGFERLFRPPGDDTDARLFACDL
jgi:ribosomal-protein-alanine N-acetyltransferase